MATITTTNPATEEKISTFTVVTNNQIKQAVDDARNAFNSWKAADEERKNTLHAMSEYLKKNSETLAKVATNEMGKVIKESKSEVEKCAWAMEFYADNGQIFLQEETLNTDARKSTIKFEPLGVIASIMPWNFPYWQALRFAAPSLMAGNVVVLKPASATLQSGIEIENAFKEIDAKKGIFHTLIGNSDSATTLIDSDINAVTFTGSEKAGAKVGKRASANLKKCVLELGGSDPFIILDDADIDKATDGAVKGRFINCGQSCIASKRFFVSKEVAEEFTEKFIHKTEKLVVGDPLSENSDLGPLVNKDALDRISEMVQDAKKKGCNVLTGGEQLHDGKGYFYKPTILTDIKDNMDVASEETFGPIAPITIIEDEDEAIRLANDSKYGLGASIWTENLKTAEVLSDKIESGIVSVNNVVVSDPRIPFGGIKNSGFGRELSRYGMLEFVSVKSIRFYDDLVSHHYVE
ncbi:NAD-dependent succinate-semialdehyde dehydrogenase [Nitrosopumilus sp.]|uniref:NAD-dependent succinate-semialdehyde dehydrogenase n=1 Tax=Nitrosopumilus sp. TaxID=2024843 RepID=UPI003B5AE3F0